MYLKEQPPIKVWELSPLNVPRYFALSNTMVLLSSWQSSNSTKTSNACHATPLLNALVFLVSLLLLLLIIHWHLWHHYKWIYFPQRNPCPWHYHHQHSARTLLTLILVRDCHRCRRTSNHFHQHSIYHTALSSLPLPSPKTCPSHCKLQS